MLHLPPKPSLGSKVNTGDAASASHPPFSQCFTAALVYAYSHHPEQVLLEPAEHWPDDRPLPPLLSFDGTYIRASRDDFIANAQFLQRLKFSCAVFANCGSVKVSKRFTAATRNCLKQCRCVVIIHNEDTLEDLLGAFQGVESLSLSHDLRTHVAGLRTWAEQGKRHPLQHLSGSCAALGLSELALDDETLSNLVLVCPQISGVLFNLKGALSRAPDALPLPNSPLSYAVIGPCVDHGICSLAAGPNASPNNVRVAAQQSPCVHHLHVTTGSREAVSNIALFKNISELSITYTSRCQFDVCESFLGQFKLRELQLYQFEDVRISFLAEHSRSLNVLRLFRCTVTEQILENERLRNLRVLSLGSEVPSETFLSLLVACPNLLLLELFLEELSVYFLLAESQKVKLPNLTGLLLTTQVPVVKLGVTTGHLEQLLHRLPQLIQMRTDDYSVRLFFERFAAHVTLGWTSCTVCSAEYPRINGNDKLWEEACRRCL